MIRRLFLGLAAAAAFAAAAAVLVFALAFALFALVEPYVGRAGAAAILAGVTALSIGLAAMFIGSLARARPRKTSSSDTVWGMIERAVAFVREKPILAASAAIGAGFMAVRNPAYLGSVIRAFVEGKPPPRQKGK